MKFMTTVTINKPVEYVADIISNRENLLQRKQNLQSIETIVGNDGEVGNVKKLVFQYGGRYIMVYETLLKSEYPHEFQFETKGNGVQMVFTIKLEEENGNTKYILIEEFKFKGLLRLTSKFFKKKMK